MYVGEIRDSGWGAGNNRGRVVRLRFDPKSLPTGIAEIRATNNGFEIEFTRPVDSKSAEEPANYEVSSFTRVSTPVYGGDDQQRRAEDVTSVTISDDAKVAKLKLAEMRTGFVYEIRLKNLVGGNTFFPDYGYYTLNERPD